MPRRSTVCAVTTIGIDMGKNTLHMVGLNSLGALVLRERVSRGRITSRLANLPPCLIGIEAGMATHYVARELAALGHDAKQVPPAYAKPFRQGHKNDFRDAHAVAEAVQRPTTRFVPAKTDEQLDLQALHRVRSRLVSERTKVNATDWELSVADNGVGKQDGVFAQAKTGLGSGIVKALAQTNAQVKTLSGVGGTTVSVTHATFSKAGSRADS